MAIMVDAKLVALEDRLCPRDRPMRPPLRADGEKNAAHNQPTPRARSEENTPGATKEVTAGKPATLLTKKIQRVSQPAVKKKKAPVK